MDKSPIGFSLDHVEWIKLEPRFEVKPSSSYSMEGLSKKDEEGSSEDKTESNKENYSEIDHILRGPIWNYGIMKEDEEKYYYDLLFGKKHNTVLTPSEMILKGEKWNPSKPMTDSLCRYIFRRLKKADPESIALLEIETGRSLKYKEVVEKAYSLACGLRWAGVLPGHVIALVAFNSLEAHLMILASLLLGSITALVDPSLSPVGIGRLFRIANPRIVFCEYGKTVMKVQVALGYMITPLRPKIIVNTPNNKKTRNEAGFIPYEKLLAEVEKDFKPAFRHYNPDNPVFIIFTSGITSIPKGALISEQYFMENGIFMESVLFTSTFPYTSLVTAAIFWVIGIFSLLSHLINRHKIVFFRGQVLEPALIKAFAKFKVTVWITGTDTLLCLLKWPAKPRLHTLKLIMVTGMSLREKALARIQNEVFNGKVDICQIFGMTEIGIVTANLPHENKLGSVGKLLRNVQMKVLEEDTGLILGPNQEGQLCFRSESMMLGYCTSHDSEDIFDSEGYVHTGDLGYYDNDGFVYITGRLKDIIKWKCYQVIPQDIEELLLGQPGVHEAVVIGLPHETDGELVTAAILLKPGYEKTDTSILEKNTNEHLSPSMKIRGGVYCLSSFPRNSAGKPKKADIIKLIVQQNLKRQHSSIHVEETSLDSPQRTMNKCAPNP